MVIDAHAHGAFAFVGARTSKTSVAQELQIPRRQKKESNKKKFLTVLKNHELREYVPFPKYYHK